MKHNTTGGKAAETQMFKGMRNLESQGSGGELGVAGSEGCTERKRCRWFWPGVTCSPVVTGWWWWYTPELLARAWCQGHKVGWGFSMLEPSCSLLPLGLFWVTHRHSSNPSTSLLPFLNGAKRAELVKNGQERCLPLLPASLCYPRNPDRVCRACRALTHSLGIIYHTQIFWWNTAADEPLWQLQELENINES